MKRLTAPLSVAAISLLALLARTAQAEVPTDPPGKYFTSWLGNTFMDADGHKNVTELLNDLAVSTNGHVFTAGYAETWGDGATYAAADGAFIARYDRFESGFGDPASVVAADDDYVYYGTSAKGILRAPHGGARGGYEAFLPDVNVQGLFCRSGKLYVSDFGAGKIRVLNAATMTEERNWDCAKPTHLTADGDGNVWVVSWSATSLSPPDVSPMWWGDKVVSFSADGKPRPVIDTFERPLAVAFEKDGRLMVGGLNAHSQIWLYDTSSAPKKVGAFGADGGIFSGTAGQFTESAKLHWIKSISTDSAGTIYTGCTYGTFWGGVIEKFAPTGALLWRDFAGTSLDVAGIDPDNDTEIYSKVPPLLSRLVQVDTGYRVVSKGVHRRSLQVSERLPSRSQLGRRRAVARRRRLPPRRQAVRRAELPRRIHVGDVPAGDRYGRRGPGAVGKDGWR